MWRDEQGPPIHVIRVDPKTLRESFLDRLRGRVFHSTRMENLPGILKVGAILPRSARPQTPGFPSSEHAYFASIGCVSFFDYESPAPEQIESSLDPCAPWDASTDGGFALLFLREEARDRLIREGDVRAEVPTGEMVVWNVEAGYPGPVPMEDIEEIWEVHLDEDPLRW